jgi:hypothetical protein
VIIAIDFDGTVVDHRYPEKGIDNRSVRDEPFPTCRI